MPTFNTPQSISVTVDLGVGDVGVVASQRLDTVVEVTPSNQANRSAVITAEHARIEYVDGVLRIKAPRGLRQYRFGRGSESINVRIELPSGSRLRCNGRVATVYSSGHLSKCYVKTVAGGMKVADADVVELATGAGSIGVGCLNDRADITTGSGTVRIGNIGGPAVIRNSNGDSWIGDVAGDLRVSSVNGPIVVDRARAAVAATSVNGNVRLGEVAHGAIAAQTRRGEIEVGVLDGVPARLDLTTQFGKVHNSLRMDERHQRQHPVEVFGRTSFGDITVRDTLAKASSEVKA
jgi:DUF4097 and DUF4098 domain-containing protein YvlB